MGINYIDYIEIGKRIKKFRKEQNMTQNDLSTKAQISKPHMSHIETGMTKLSLPTLISIACALNVTVDQLLRDNVDYSSPVVLFSKDIDEKIKDCSSFELRMILEAIDLIKTISRNSKNKR